MAGWTGGARDLTITLQAARGTELIGRLGQRARTRQAVTWRAACRVAIVTDSALIAIVADGVVLTTLQETRHKQQSRYSVTHVCCDNRVKPCVGSI